MQENNKFSVLFSKLSTLDILMSNYFPPSSFQLNKLLPHIRGLSHQGKKFVTWVLSFSPYRQCRNVRMREVMIMKMIFSFATNVWNRRIINSILLQLRKYCKRPFLKNCVTVLPIPIHCLSIYFKLYFGICIIYLFFFVSEICALEFVLQISG